MTETRESDRISTEILPATQETQAAGQPRRSAATRILMFVPNLLRRRSKTPDEVIVYSAHPSFYLWLLIVAGFVAGPIVRAYPDAADVAGWIYVGILVYFLVTLLYDFSTRKLALWAGIFLLIFLGSKYVEHLRNFTMLGSLIGYLAGLRPKLDPGTVIVLSWVLLVPWIGSVLDMLLNRRKRFSPNEIAEFHFGEGHELTDRSGLRFRTKYRDLLETLLSFGGGDLLAVDNHQNVIKHYDNILGLYFKWPALDRVLHQRAASIDEGDAAN